MKRHIPIEKLWNISEKYSSEMIPVSLFDHMMKENIWEEKFELDRFIFHMKKCLSAEKTYPIIAVKGDDEKLFVLDGMHRLSFAIANNKNSVLAVILPKEYSDTVVLG